MARLAMTLNGDLQTYALTETGLAIGRALDNDVVLNHAIVSRRHARVELRAHDAWIADLGSRNGIFVNRLRVREQQLADGDLIQIGPFEIRFEARAAQRVVLDDDKYFPLAAESRRIQSGELPDLIPDVREFYQISRRLNAVIALNELLELVMDEALRLVPAQRGLLLLYRHNELVPMVVRPASQSEVALSSTIARKALEASEAVLTRDARLDFAGAQSIIAANIRSAICVPLVNDAQAIGLIYVDSPGQNQFDERQRDLLAALASQAAIAIERARLSEELQRQAELRQNLERFMSPNVAQMVERYFDQHGQLWEPQELTVSVLFADVKGFTSLAEGLSPREVQDLLNEYLHEMTEVVFQHQGTLDKYIGDGIMALFGAPRLANEADDRHAERAVNAALDMIEAHRRLIEKNDPSQAFAFRIGINTGPVYAGFFGTRQRLEYTAIGDTVNTASRIEGKAEANTALITEATADALGGQFQLEEVGEIQLKGRANLVRAFKVLGRIAHVQG